MGTISTGVGLISGLDYRTMIDQLMALEARPRDQLINRVGNINAQRTAYLEISARITALLSRIDVLTRPATFQGARATSSLPDVLAATAGAGAQPGTYTFLVRALAATHQLVSRGFADRNAPVASGTLTLESGRARVNGATRLDELNGQSGVRRGSFKIVNGAGQEATVNIADALTVGEVIDKINAAGISVRASVRGDGLVLTDVSGGSGGLRVLEVAGGRTAADLGFGLGNNQSTGTELAGTAVMYLSAATRTAALNDGLGIRAAPAGGDFGVEAGGANFSVDLSEIIKPDTRLERLNHGQGVRLGRVRVTSVDKTFREVDLTNARTVNDVKQAFEAAFGNSRITVVLTGAHLVISDQTNTTNLPANEKGDFIIEDVTGYAARDLGIDGRSAQGRVTGRDVLHMDTLADVLAAVNYATGNADAGGQRILTAAIGPNGHGLVLRAAGAFTLRDPDPGSVSHALADLGFAAGTYTDEIAGGHVLGGIDTVMLKTLNGGTGVAGTRMSITANGRTAELDFSDAHTLAEVVERIRTARDAGGASLGIAADYDATGTRIVVSNATAGGGDITISGDFADALGLTQTGAIIRSNNLQRQYVNEATRLADLNNGRGIALGKIKLTNSLGVSVDVDLTTAKTIQDVIDSIGAAGLNVTASVNATGDGLLLTDTAGGTGTLTVAENGATTARDLNLLKRAENNQIDGALEFRLQIGASETLESLASRINNETTLAQATLLNDGSAFAPYRLSISSRVSGAAGELLIDEGATGLGVTTLAQAQDARVFFGGGASGGLLLTSPTNNFSGVVPGLTFSVQSIEDKPVTVTVDRDLDTLVTTLKGLVDDYNTAVDRMKDAAKYDAEHEQLGILQGDSTLYAVRNRLDRIFTGATGPGGAFARLADVGIKLDGGGHLTFEEEQFRSAFTANPEAVQRFFSEPETGAAVQIKKAIEEITGAGGLIEKRTGALEDRKELLEERITDLNARLDRKRERLMKQFQAMEAVLAQLQGQQQALASLAALAQSAGTWSSTR